VKHGIQWIQWWKKPISGSGEGIRGPQWPKEAPKTFQNLKACAVPQSGWWDYQSLLTLRHALSS